MSGNCRCCDRERPGHALVSPVPNVVRRGGVALAVGWHTPEGIVCVSLAPPAIAPVASATRQTARDPLKLSHSVAESIPEGRVVDVN
jgi:hypothetical protein